jgi:CRISPR-associated exonuclease Cas4
MWLHANEIRFESNSEDVAMGLLINETSYPQRAEKYSEIEMEGIKIDFFDAKNKVVHEIKKSDSHEEAHEWQVKYYIYVLERNGVEGATGILEYPKMRETREITLNNIDREQIQFFETDIKNIISSETCPERLPQSKCRNCSYFDFCWSGEES